MSDKTDSQKEYTAMAQLILKKSIEKTIGRRSLGKYLDVGESIAYDYTTIDESMTDMKFYQFLMLPMTTKIEICRDILRGEAEVIIISFVGKLNGDFIDEHLEQIRILGKISAKILAGATNGLEELANMGIDVYSKFKKELK